MFVVAVLLCGSSRRFKIILLLKKKKKKKTSIESSVPLLHTMIPRSPILLSDINLITQRRAAAGQDPRRSPPVAASPSTTPSVTRISRHSGHIVQWICSSLEKQTQEYIAHTPQGLLQNPTSWKIECPPPPPRHHF